MGLSVGANLVDNKIEKLALYSDDCNGIYTIGNLLGTYYNITGISEILLQ